MKVYVVVQAWNNPYEGSSYNIIDAYDSIEKARIRLNECYHDDIEWALEHDVHDDELDENTLEQNYSYISWEEFWSSNTIEERDLL